jgi:6-pyruvoyl-tetrahydropterin synthase
VRYSSSATIWFSAGHTPEPNAWCGDKPHGHRYTVNVTWDREGYPTTDHAAWIEARQMILMLCLELKDRDLNKMLGAQVPNVFGVAAFFMERLSINIPVTKVKVREDDGPVAIIERDH